MESFEFLYSSDLPTRRTAWLSNGGVSGRGVCGSVAFFGWFILGLPLGVDSSCSAPAGKMCLEGQSIASGSVCSAQCATGYTPSVVNLSCTVSKLTPPTFSCLENPCTLRVQFASKPCSELNGSVVPSSSRCTTHCDTGYLPTVPFVDCLLGVLKPASFSCEVSCLPPSGITYSDIPACNVWEIPNGSVCLTRCLEGYIPSIGELSCRNGVLSPSSFVCNEAPCQGLQSTMLLSDVENFHMVQYASTPSCREGYVIPSQGYCTTQCIYGYGVSDFDKLYCERKVLNPPSFKCVFGVCVEPFGVANVKLVRTGPNADEVHPISCLEGHRIQHLALCTPACEDGYYSLPSVLSCYLGLFSFATFQCFPFPCATPRTVDIFNSASVPCYGDVSVSFLSDGRSCATACAEGYEPSDLLLHCRLGNLSPPNFTCSEKACGLPVVANTPASYCLGIDAALPVLAHGHTCVVICGAGYAPSHEYLECQRGILSPLGFNCTPKLCTPPVVPNAVEPSCGVESKIMSGTACYTHCAMGFTPSAVQLSCLRGVLSPPTFTCVGGPCSMPNPGDILYANNPSCADGALVNDSGICLSQCIFGYVPLMSVLRCVGTVFTPPAFSCIPASVLVSAQPDSQVAAPVKTEGLVSSGLGLHRALYCYGNSYTMTTVCALMFGTVQILRRSNSIEISYDRLFETTLVQLGTNDTASFCYSSPSYPSGRCIGLNASGFALRTGAEMTITGSAFVVRSLVSVALSTWPSSPSGAAVICYAKGAVSVSCRRLHLALDGNLSAGPEISVRPGSGMYLALACFASNRIVLCLADSRLQRTGVCHLIYDNGSTALAATDGVILHSGSVAHISVAAFPASSGIGVACFSDWANGEVGVCKMLTMSSDTLSLQFGASLTFNNGITRYTSLVALHSHRALVYYQDEATLDQSFARARKLTLQNTAIVLGAEVVVSNGTNLVYGLSLAPLSLDTSLACFSDAWQSDLALCRVLWAGSSNSPSSDPPVICVEGAPCRAMFLRPPEEAPNPVTMVRVTNPSLGVVNISWQPPVSKLRASQTLLFQISNDGFNMMISNVSASTFFYSFASELPLARRNYSVRAVNSVGPGGSMNFSSRADFMGCMNYSGLLALQSEDQFEVVVANVTKKEDCLEICWHRCARYYALSEGTWGNASCFCGNSTLNVFESGCVLCSVSVGSVELQCGNVGKTVTSVYEVGVVLNYTKPPRDYYNDYRVSTDSQPFPQYPVESINDGVAGSIYVSGPLPVVLNFVLGRPFFVNGFRTRQSVVPSQMSIQSSLAHYTVTCVNFTQLGERVFVASSLGMDHYSMADPGSWMDNWFDDDMLCRRLELEIMSTYGPGNSISLESLNWYGSPLTCV